MKYELNARQYKVLEGLAYWVADAAYISERCGNDPELTAVRDNISAFAPRLDALQVPYWVQNAVAVFAEDWRQYQSMYLDNYLKTRGITRAA